MGGDLPRNLYSTLCLISQASLFKQNFDESKMRKE